MRVPLVIRRSYVQVITSKENNIESGWFALRTRHQHENRVATALQNKGIEAFLPTLDDMIQEGLVTLEKVRVVHYRPG